MFKRRISRGFARHYRPPQGWTVIRHVLSPFSAEDSSRCIAAAIEYLVPAVVKITDGVDLAMNRFNPCQAKEMSGISDVPITERRSLLQDTGKDEEKVSGWENDYRVVRDL